MIDPTDDGIQRDLFGLGDGGWKRLVDDGPFGFLMTDYAGVIAWINTTLAESLGYPPGELVGRRTFQELLAPGGRIYFDTHLRPMLHVRREAREIALEILRSDGSRQPSLVNFRRRERLDAAGSFVEIIVFDASERRNYEAELLHAQRAAERSESRLQVMYEIASGLAAAATVDDIVKVVAEQGHASSGGARCSVWVLDDGRRSVMRLGHVRSGLAVPGEIAVPEHSPALQQLARGALVIIADHTVSRHEYPLICDWMARSGVRSAAVAPMLTDGVLVGAVSYGFDEAHEFEPADMQAASALAALTEQALRRARLVNTELRGKRRLEMLLNFTTRLSGAYSLDDVLDVIVASSHDLLGAVGVRLALLDETTRNLEFVRGTGTGVGGQLGQLIPIDRRSIACTAFRTGAIQIAGSRNDVEERFPDSAILSDGDFGRCIAAPLRRGSDVVGAWVMSYPDPGIADGDEIKLVELFAEHAAQATLRAKMHSDEITARNQAEIRRVISEALNRSVTTADVATVITKEGRSAFNAAGLAVFVADNQLSLLRIGSAVGLDHAIVVSTARIDEIRERCGLTSWRSPAFLSPSAEIDERIGSLIVDAKWEAAAILPLGLAGTELGLIAVGFDHEDALTNSQRVTLVGLAAEASIALARARRFDVEHEIALALQRSILPVADTTRPGWSVSTWYQPTSDMMVGGDLFDLTEVEDGRMILIVGDVVGHGLQAATAMGSLRSAAKALALVSNGPAQIVARLHAFAAASPGVFCASVCCVDISTDGGGRYSSAGHPRPILRHADGHTELLGGGRSPLLGIDGVEPTNAEFVMTRGSTLVLYTDGVVERRGIDIDSETTRLRNFVGAAFPRATAQHVVEHMLEGRHVDDDAVVVCLSRTA